MDEDNRADILTLTAEIVSSYVGANTHVQARISLASSATSGRH